MGDSSDNIPGVKGIGEKTGTTLLREYGSVAGIYDHIDEIRGATRKKLEAGAELATLSRELALIQCEVPVPFTLDDCVAHDFDADKVFELLRTLEFRSLGDRVKKVEQTDMFAAEPETAPVETAVSDVETILVRDETALAALVEALTGGGGHRLGRRDDRRRPDVLRPGGHRAGSGWRARLVHPAETSGGATAVAAGDAGRPARPADGPDHPQVRHNAAYDLS